MTAGRRIRLWDTLVTRADGGPVAVEHVGAVVVAAAGVDGVAVAVMLDAVPREMVYASDQRAADLEDLTLTLGEGPSVEAEADGPVLIADLGAAASLARWPVFAPTALRAGVRALFAFPLRVGAIRMGVMDLHRTSTGELSREQLADALVLADTACALLLDAAAGDRPQPARGPPEPAAPHHPEVHQATGMVTVQLGVSAAVALVRLRANAYAHDRRRRDVAQDVVARRLRFEPDAEDSDDDQP